MKQKRIAQPAIIAGLVVLTGLFCLACGGPPTGGETSMPAVATVPLPASTVVPASPTVQMEQGQDAPVTADRQSTGLAGPDALSAVVAAKADLAASVGVGSDAIQVLLVEEVVWPDTSLGCPQPGMNYAQVLQDGLLIRLGVAGRVYTYHSSDDADPFLCADADQMSPQVIPKDDELNPPPGSETD